jgi:hypothetical protein
MDQAEERVRQSQADSEALLGQLKTRIEGLTKCAASSSCSGCWRDSASAGSRAPWRRRLGILVN